MIIIYFLTLILFVVIWGKLVFFFWYWSENTELNPRFFFPSLVLNIFTTLFLDISWFQNTTHLHTKQNSLMSESELKFLKWIVKQNKTIINGTIWSSTLATSQLHPRTKFDRCKIPIDVFYLDINLLFFLDRSPFVRESWCKILLGGVSFEICM